MMSKNSVSIHQENELTWNARPQSSKLGEPLCLDPWVKRVVRAS